ncbi:MULTISPECIES: branched-chain amino acid ABC transporter ATP-binding protein/permease [unclassified Nocardioides]|uniref:branched-chain amino acid ABC transporter ATP-binding protein/permease n=1 Tax=unclassified Nocardioides TaxID=2615069 RepID=UPI0000EB6015|nr:MULTISPECIES: branched-chain amino acid ABC transporter ATP-binding protein/permease [unclassified Nocardioides]ABL79761.1 amino acid/amide ABC transporter ATP-binding protein 1, HAAT family / amino acid/amide ABC transporter membrane protein 2, HAAT family [Nocardioides sp. JS614]
MWLNYLVQAVLLASLALSVNLLVGYAGQVSVAHAAFAGVGGYTIAYLTTARDWPFVTALVAATLIAAAVGVVIGLIALGLAEEFLILMTLAFSLAVIGIFATFDALGGVMGITNVTGLSILGHEMTGPRDWLVPALGTLVVTFAVCWRIGESPYGRVLKGIREDSDATRSLGKNTFAYKVGIFAITAGMAGWVGGLYSGWLGLATPSAFGFPLAMSVFAMVIVGGSANLFGSVLAAGVLTLIEPTLREALAMQSSQAALVQIVLYGALLVVMMILRPQGLLAERFRHVTPPASGPVELVAERGAPVVRRLDAHPVVLRAEGLEKRFGGIVAARNLSLELRRGTITALVGPNGAGKTTAFNLLTGAIAPDRGSVLLDGQELVGRRPDEIVRAGLVRTYQDVRLLGRLTCLENVMLGVPDQHGEHLGRLFVPGRAVSRADRAVAERALEWLGFVGMAEQAGVPTEALSYGQTKLVSLARALATEAPVLLLDEPASGVDSAWVETMLRMIDAVRAEGRTVCLVEHNLDVVRELADHTYFMELGEITASGTIAELTSSARLTEAYFGAQ